MQTDPNLSEDNVFFEESVSQPPPQPQTGSVLKYLIVTLLIVLPLIGVFVGYQLGASHFSPQSVPTTEVVPNVSEEVTSDADESKDIVVAENPASLQDGTYAVVRSRHIDDNEWFDVSVVYSPDRGYTWEQYVSVYDDFAFPHTYVLYDELYFAVTEGWDTADALQTNFYKVDLSTKEKISLGAVDGYVTDFGVTPQGILAMVPTNPLCGDKPINCTSALVQLEDQTSTTLGMVQGVTLEMYGAQGVITRGGYGDAGCLSVELYDYDLPAGRAPELQDSYKDGGCMDDPNWDFDVMESIVNNTVREFAVDVNPYYERTDGNAFDVVNEPALALKARDVEEDRVGSYSDEVDFAYSGEVTVLAYPEPSVTPVSGTLAYLEAPAQTELPGFNLDEEKYPRDMLYPDGGNGKLMPLSEVAKFNSTEHCLVVYQNGVHDISILLRMADKYPAIDELRDKCGTDLDAYIAAQPIQAGSLNTARFAYIMVLYWIGYWVES